MYRFNIIALVFFLSLKCYKIWNTRERQHDFVYYFEKVILYRFLISTNIFL